MRSFGLRAFGKQMNEDGPAVENHGGAIYFDKFQFVYFLQ